MTTENEEILAVLDAVIRYLAIDLPCQSLTPDVEMGRESLLNKVELLCKKIGSNCNNKHDSNKQESLSSEPANGDEIYDDVDSGEGQLDKRTSSYVVMNQFLSTIEAHLEKEQILEEKQDLQSNSEENYEISEPNREERSSTDIKEEDNDQEVYENADLDEGSQSDRNGDSNGESKMETDDVAEFTDDELLEKLKGMENTSPKIICNGSLCSGFMLKQKKKMLSKWNKRFCIVKDVFMFYYKSENDNKSLGVIVLPGYTIQIESKLKFIFKLTPTSKGRSTYLFQLSNEAEMDKWLKVISPICSQKLNRLKSDVFNRVAKHLDEKAENDEGSGGEKVKPPMIQEDREMYEPIPEDGLHSSISSNSFQTHSDHIDGEIYDDVAAVQELAEEDEYDDHIGVQRSVNIPQPAANTQDELYEGIPGESYEPETSGVEPIQEDIYEDIPSVHVPPPRPPVGSAPPPSPKQPTSPVPVLPPRTPVLPPRGAPARPGNEEVPLPPSIPSRKPVSDGPVELIQEESDDEEPSGPLESDFSYENVYIGTANFNSNEADELDFNRGDLIYVLDKINPHWWVGCLNEKVGLVQSNVLVPGFAR